MADLDVVVLSGSLRAASINSLVAETLIARAPGGVRMVRHDLRPIPFFDQDVEDAGDPQVVTDLKQAVIAADALLVVSPEYNVGVPAVMKNAIDWLSRPYGDGAIVGTATGIISASPGGRGGVGARAHLSDSLGVLTDRLFPETLGLARMYGRIGDGALDGDALAELMSWFGRFRDFAAG